MCHKWYTVITLSSFILDDNAAVSTDEDSDSEISLTASVIARAKARVSSPMAFSFGMLIDQMLILF